MSQQISITIQDQIFTAELNDSPAAGQLRDALPLKLRMSRWGDEYYGDCGLTICADTGARELVEVGERRLLATGKRPLLFLRSDPGQYG